MMNDAGELLQPKGTETMNQDDSTPPAEPEGFPTGTSDGVKVYDGRYTRYTFYGITFEVSSRYVPPIVPLGKGASGIVCSAVDAQTGDEVAIKKIGNAFQDKTDAKRTLREILLLRNMNHPNVIAIRDLIKPPRPNLFSDVYIVYELMPTDLHEVIRSKQQMDERHYKFILYQLLRGLNYIHSANVLHRDLKPPNILIDAKCNVKIADFGLARTKVGLEDHMTEYVVTRYYRAPELLLNCQDYTAAIDVWSVGCIYMELVTGEILLKGDNYVDQLRRTCKLIGTPSLDDLSFLRNENARQYILTDMPHLPKQSFQQLFPRLSPLGADLVERMLVFDPQKRITVEEALAHPYLGHYHRQSDEPVHENPFRYDLSFEQEDYSIAHIRQIIYEQACLFNP
eukprot:TRINITY_DN3798_c0_g1_i1.p1 TRINITY_DN3798_c0_g1~~TRINITY_DN3798_c0_g1_i1.p1  ORF type:complete len:397 (-),score=56.58 TRINITY_DN3798_c0_g1_i1:368-1558(-)